MQPSSQLIYRIPGDRAKDLSLHRERDWKTGLSFYDYEPVGSAFKFDIDRLKSNGYIIIFDGGLSVVTLPFWNSEPVIEPNTGEKLMYPQGHITVYHSDFDYWQAWHLADKANVGSPQLSDYLIRFYNLRES
jgi:hypothetical protein